MTQYARVETKTAYMSGDFAVSYATRLFGADAVAALPQISRGKRKGAAKGVLTWTRATVGGWVRDAAGGGRVVYPGFVNATVTVDGKVALETTFASFEKLEAARAAREAERAKVAADAAAWQAEIMAELEAADPEYAARVAAKRAARAEAEIDAEIARRQAAKAAA
jgi:hypothetical protein